MTLFELQAWPGHRPPQPTQFYAKISPVTLTRAHDDAGYLARNVRAGWPDTPADRCPRPGGTAAGH